MKIPKKVVETVEAKSVCLYAKLSDSGGYELLDQAGNKIAERNDYVPAFFPHGIDGKSHHHGDYITLNIDLETGQIINWKKPDAEDVARAFNLIESE